MFILITKLSIGYINHAYNDIQHQILIQYLPKSSND